MSGYHEMGNRQGEAFMGNLGTIADLRATLDEAERLQKEAEEILKELGLEE